MSTISLCQSNRTKTNKDTKSAYWRALKSLPAVVSSIGDSMQSLSSSRPTIGCEILVSLGLSKVGLKASDNFHGKCQFLVCLIQYLEFNWYNNFTNPVT